MKKFDFKEVINEVINSYKQNAGKTINLKKEQGRVYNSMSAMLKETFLLGATKYGENFIA